MEDVCDEMGEVRSVSARESSKSCIDDSGVLEDARGGGSDPGRGRGAKVTEVSLMRWRVYAMKWGRSEASLQEVESSKSRR